MKTKQTSLPRKPGSINNIEITIDKNIKIIVDSSKLKYAFVLLSL
jgi:hypothetical protein